MNKISSVEFNNKRKIFQDPYARRAIRFIKKNLGWSKYFCRIDLKV